MAERLVTVRSFWTEVEAHLAKNRLEAEGIPAFLADETTVSTAWHLGNAVGGVKLQVAEPDAERATVVLDAPAGPVEAPDEAECAEGEDPLRLAGGAGESVPEWETPVMAAFDAIKRPVIWLFLFPIIAGLCLVSLALVTWIISLLF